MTKLLITPQLLVGIISAAFILSACSPKENAVDDTAATATDERETVALNQDSDESPIQKKPTAKLMMTAT